MKIQILLSFLLFSTSFFAQTKNCNQVKTGKFVLLDSIHGNTFIIRKNRTQIEYGELSKLKLKLKITWKDKCNYTLELIKVIKNPNKMSIPRKYFLEAEIIEVTDTYYLVKSLTRENTPLIRKISIM